jgi:hypothetical protein
MAEIAEEVLVQKMSRVHASIREFPLIRISSLLGNAIIALKVGGRIDYRGSSVADLFIVRYGNMRLAGIIIAHFA